MIFHPRLQRCTGNHNKWALSAFILSTIICTWGVKSKNFWGVQWTFNRMFCWIIGSHKSNVIIKLSIRPVSTITLDADGQQETVLGPGKQQTHLLLGPFLSYKWEESINGIADPLTLFLPQFEMAFQSTKQSFTKNNLFSLVFVYTFCFSKDCTAVC